MAERSIELNADFGEGFGVYPLPAQVWRAEFERTGTLAPEAGAPVSIEDYLSLVSVVNLACGFHAGDPLLIKSYIAASLKAGCTVGAHVSFPDLAGFGNRYMELAPADLRAVLQYQFGALAGLLKTFDGAGLTHVKAHGVLYNRAMDDLRLATTVAEAIAEYDDTLPVYGLPGSAQEEAAAKVGIPFRREAFSDRAYHATGRLVDRSRADAMILDPDAVATRVVRMVAGEEVVSVEGESVAIRPDTISFHSDSPGALAMLRKTVESLAEAGIAVRGGR